jgi:hypothetical protein
MVEACAGDTICWLHKADELPREEVKREVEKHLTGKRQSRGNCSISSCSKANCR